MIGVGNQGGPKNNMKYFFKNIVAMCDLDKNYLAEAGAFLQKEANLSATMTDDYRRVLDAKDVDAVVVTVPDQWHALMTIDACQAGKDVYCEKPLTLVIGEGRPMIDAARKHGRVVQTGTMQRSGEEFKLAVELVRKGIVGKVKAVNVTLPGPNWIARAGKPVPDSDPPEGFDFNRWLGPAPLRPYNKNRVHYLFRFYWDYSGGQQTNFGAHHLDIAQWGLGMDESGPVSVEGSAVYNPDGWYETPDTTEIKYTYANGVVMTCRQKLDTKGNDQGTEFIGDKGSLFVYRGGIVANPPRTAEGRGAAEDHRFPGELQPREQLLRLREDRARRPRRTSASAIARPPSATSATSPCGPRRRSPGIRQTETIVGDAEAVQVADERISQAVEPGLKGDWKDLADDQIQGVNF